MTETRAGDLAVRITEAEARVPGLRPGCEKRIVWAGASGRPTPLSLVYVHGFSASPEELRPVPDRVAQALGANLFFTRLGGHGQDGAAMGRATLDDWRGDMAEAAEIGEALGERTLWMGCSTGGTLITLALAEGASGAGAILVSPNYRLASPLATGMLDLPGAATWMPWITGRDREFQVLNNDHGRYWTPRYPTSALFPMAEAMRAARTARLRRLPQPALFVYSPGDRIVSARATRAVISRWGGPAEAVEVACGADDDPMRHVIAGDIFSPKQTPVVADRMIDWARAQGL